MTAALLAGCSRPLVRRYACGAGRARHAARRGLSARGAAAGPRRGRSVSRRPTRRRPSSTAPARRYYRDGKWEEARIEYRAAEAADPTFLAPRLNVACSFVRQERFAEATAEVEALLARAYVPWAREVLEAADLGALKPRPEMARIRRAMTAAAAAWGADLDDAVLFVGRARAPLQIPARAPAFFILNPHQEVYAFLPSTGRFRQLTNEDGRVLAMLRTPDRRRVVYVTAEKLIRGARTATLDAARRRARRADAGDDDGRAADPRGRATSAASRSPRSAR